MLRRKKPGRVQFCVELNLSANQTAMSQHRQLGVVARRLVSTFDRFGIGATWASPHPSTSLLADLSRTVRHEFAILVDHSWPKSSDNLAFGAELRKRLHAADENRIRISALVFAQSSTSAEIRQAAQCQLGVIRHGGLTHERRRHTANPKRPSMTAGQLHLATTAVFPGFGRFLGIHDAGFAAKYVLHRAMKNSSTEHVTIRAEEMLEQPDKILRAIRHVLALSAKLEQSGRLQIQSMRSAQLQSRSARATSPARSILRPAA